MCIDYCGLNAITDKNKFQLPRIEEILDSLVGAKVFSKMDLQQGFNQIRIKEGDEAKTTFRTRFGHFQFLVMLFGLTNAPASFQAMMTSILREFLGKFAEVFIDDMLVYSKNFEDHRIHLEVVLRVLLEQKLLARLSKCNFFQTEVEYLGFIISAEGIATDPSESSSYHRMAIASNFDGGTNFLGHGSSNAVFH